MFDHDFGDRFIGGNILGELFASRHAILTEQSKRYRAEGAVLLADLCEDRAAEVVYLYRQAKGLLCFQ